jgi:hypothetical protein
VTGRPQTEACATGSLISKLSMTDGMGGRSDEDPRRCLLLYLTRAQPATGKLPRLPAASSAARGAGPCRKFLFRLAPPAAACALTLPGADVGVFYPALLEDFGQTFVVANGAGGWAWNSRAGFGGASQPAACATSSGAGRRRALGENPPVCCRRRWAFSRCTMA